MSSTVHLERGGKGAPPTLIGQMEVDVCENSEALYKVWSALATRNTAGTAMNDTSSRSHCFASLNLYAYTEANGTVRMSRLLVRSLE